MFHKVNLLGNSLLVQFGMRAWVDEPEVIKFRCSTVVYRIGLEGNIVLVVGLVIFLQCAVFIHQHLGAHSNVSTGYLSQIQ